MPIDSTKPSSPPLSAPTTDLTPVKLSVLLPVRNEGFNLRIMLKMLPVVIGLPHEVLVIVDSPEDESIEVVRALEKQFPQLHLVENKIGKGVVNALRAGVRAAQGEFCLIFAADEIGPLLAVEDMLALTEEGCEFVSCTRYAHGGRRLGGSFLGGLLSRTACYLLHTLGGSVFTDSSTGIKLFRREVFDKLGLESKPVGWVVAFEMALKAQTIGLRLGEVPIVSVDRLYGGKSTFRLWSWIRAYWKWFLWGCRNLRKHARPSIAVRIPTHMSR